MFSVVLKTLQTVGQSGLDTAAFGLGNGTILTQATTTLGVLGGHEVTGTCFEVPELTSSGLLEPFCGTFSGFELGHCFHLSFG